MPLHVSLDPGGAPEQHGISDAHTTWSSDGEVGYHIYELADPVDPGETIDLTFDLTVSHRGFVNHAPDTADRPQRDVLRQRPLLPGDRIRRRTCS